MRTTAVNVQSAISFFTLLFFLVISFPPNSYQYIQDFLCLIVHLINVNKSVQILRTRPPMIPIAIEITNICTKLRVVVYVMQKTTHTSKTSGKESKNFLNISSTLLCFIYKLYLSKRKSITIFKIKDLQFKHQRSSILFLQSLNKIL